MVTGLEIAGLILATFPIIVNGIESYDNGFNTIKEWSRFRNEFTVFMKAVGKQKLFFRQNIEKLLGPIVKSEDHMWSLLNEPGGRGWKDKELDDKLRKRLIGMDEYEYYMDTVGSILALLEKLKVKLKLVDGENHWTENAASSGRVRLEYEFRRLSYTLGRKKRDAIISKIEKHNAEIQTILSNSEELAPQRIKRKSSIAKHFEQVRSQASSLHAALSRALKCGCIHRAKLLLERRVSASEEMEVFGGRMEDPGIKFKVYISYELPPTNPTRAPSGPQEAYWCAMDIAIDEILNSEKAPYEALPALGSPMSPISLCSTPLMSSLTKVGSKGSRPLLDEYRRVSFADASVSSKSMCYANEGSEIIDLCSALSQQSLLQQNVGYLRDQRLDRLHTVTPGADAQLPSGGPYEVVTLGCLLGTGKGMAPCSSSALARRRTRLEIAVILATSLLQLHPGPWLGEWWGKWDIYFFRSPDGTILTHLPFVSRSFIRSTDVKQSDVRTDGAPKSPRGYNPTLLSLGILILELWFNRRIETLPFRKDYLGRGGTETEYTDYNCAQKWQEQTMDAAGIELYNPTRRCIYCAFGAASQNLEDDELRKAVYDEVVVPLKNLLQRFEEV